MVTLTFVSWNRVVVWLRQNRGAPAAASGREAVDSALRFLRRIASATQEQAHRVRRLASTSLATWRPMSIARCDSKPPNAFHTREPRRRDSAAKSSPPTLSRTCSSSCATSSMTSLTGGTDTVATTTPDESVPIRVMARLCESGDLRHSSTTTARASASSRHWWRSVADRSQLSPRRRGGFASTMSRQGHGEIRAGAGSCCPEEAEASAIPAKTIARASARVTRAAGWAAQMCKFHGVSPDPGSPDEPGAKGRGKRGGERKAVSLTRR